MKWRRMLWAIIIFSSVLSISLILSGISEMSVGKIIAGFFCGGIALFWMLVEGEGYGA